MYRWILTAVLAAALLGCDSSTITVQDAQTDSPVALPDRVTGTVQLESGAPVPNAPVMLRSVADDTLVATGTTDEQGRYSLNTNGQRSYYVSVQARFAEGTEATGGRLADLTGPGRGALETIVLPDLSASVLSIVGDQARGDGLEIQGLPSQVTALRARAYGGSDGDSFPGEPVTADESFSRLGHVWFSATDVSEDPVTQFTPPLQVRVTVSTADLRLLEDAEADTGIIEVAMVSFDESRGLWRSESPGRLEDANGQPVPESALADITAGAYAGPLTVAFQAPHFSCWSFVSFHRLGPPDYNDAPAAPEQRHLRPTVTPASPLAYDDLWLGDFVSGEQAPRRSDSADDGILFCGSQTWVKASYRRNRNRSFDRRGYLQVVQVFGDLADIEGDEGLGVDFGTQGQWTGRNIPVDNWGPGAVASAYLRLDLPSGQATTSGASGHTSGYTRLMLTAAPIDERQALTSSTFELGETEDYLDSCRYRLRINVDGDPGSQVTADGQTCTPEASCEVIVGAQETLQMQAMIDGQPVAVRWSVREQRGGPTANCPDGPTCSFTRTETARIDVRGGLAVARFPRRPVVTLSVGGRGQVTDDQGLIDCDARDPAMPPSFEACQGQYGDGDVVALTAQPADGYELSRWVNLDCLEGAVPSVCRVAMAFDERPYGRVIFAPQPTLTVAAGGGGRVVSEPAGINCDGNQPVAADCSLQQPSGTQVTLIAQPDQGQGVQSWSGACLGTQGSRCTLALTGNTEVGVNFSAAANLTASVAGAGRLDSMPAGIACTDAGGDCDEAYALGTEVELAATPAPDFGLVGWTGACAGETGFICRVTMDQPTEVGVAFGERFDLSVEVVGNGGAVDGTGNIFNCEADEAGTDPCQETYTDGDRVTLEASAFEGNEFVEWGGDCAFAAASPTCQFQISGDTRVTATFRPTVQNHPLTLTVSGLSGSAGDYDERLICNNSSSPCTQTYAAGSTVMLFAFPDDSAHAVRWGGACQGTPEGQDCTVSNINHPIDVTVEFYDPAVSSNEVVLTVTFAGQGQGQVSDNQLQLACDSGAGSCQARYAPGTEVTLSATPLSTDDVFDGWTAPASCATDPMADCRLRMDADTTATAAFGRQ